MINIHEVREVHLELSTNCNARCPLCPRNYFGYPYNAGYPVTELSIADIEKIFAPEFIAQLYEVRFNGNLGDFMLASDALAITGYFRKHNPNLLIDISTNGSARSLEFWHELAKHRPIVRFALDGLEDVHHLYRQDTNFNTIIRNSQEYITAGGHAVWKMVLFDHNKHQVEQARVMSKQLGFARFQLVDQGRNDGPVFDRNGDLSHTIGSRWHKPQESVMFYMDRQKSSQNIFFNTQQPSSNIKCVTKGPDKTIYVAANGEVYPCCWTGFYPRTFDSCLHNGNDRIKELLGDFDNNALNRPLEECLSWFDRIEQSWQHKSFNEGLPFICSRTCGN